MGLRKAWASQFPGRAAHGMCRLKSMRSDDVYYLADDAVEQHVGARGVFLIFRPDFGAGESSGGSGGYNLDVAVKLADIGFCLAKPPAAFGVVPNLVDIRPSAWRKDVAAAHAAGVWPARLRAINASKSNAIAGPLSSPRLKEVFLVIER